MNPIITILTGYLAIILFAPELIVSVDRSQEYIMGEKYDVFRIKNYSFIPLKVHLDAHYTTKNFTIIRKGEAVVGPLTIGTDEAWILDVKQCKYRNFQKTEIKVNLKLW